MAPEEDEIILDYAKELFGDNIEIIKWELPGLKSIP
jgi:hypothetical protein